MLRLVLLNLLELLKLCVNCDCRHCSYKLLYMFQAVPSPIIRSTKLYIQRQVLSKQYCCMLL